MYEKLTEFPNFTWYLPKKLSKCLLYWCGRYSYTQSLSHITYTVLAGTLNTAQSYPFFVT